MQYAEIAYFNFIQHAILPYFHRHICVLLGFDRTTNLRIAGFC